MQMFYNRNLLCAVSPDEKAKSLYKSAEIVLTKYISMSKYRFPTYNGTRYATSAADTRPGSEARPLDT